MDPEVKARVLNKLEYVGFSHTELTEQQMTRILTQSLLTTNLTWINIRLNGGIDEELCRQAKQVIQDLHVY